MNGVKGPSMVPGRIMETGQAEMEQHMKIIEKYRQLCKQANVTKISQFMIHKFISTERVQIC